MKPGTIYDPIVDSVKTNLDYQRNVLGDRQAYIWAARQYSLAPNPKWAQAARNYVADNSPECREWYDSLGAIA